VTSSADSGPGTLRAAIEAANTDPRIGEIRIATKLGVIGLLSPVEYTGAQDLELSGRARIDASGTGGDGIRSVGGADLEIEGLRIAGAPDNNIAIEVPAGATGTLRVELEDVTLVGSGNHGLFIEDQIENSDASIALSLEQVTVKDNGYGDVDQDGIRVNEGGLGGIRLTIRQSDFVGNGADGLELDEKGDGDVEIRLVGASFRENGPKDPSDLDDGLDVDEDGDGAITGRIVNSSFNDNFDQGLDLNENAAGDLRITLVNVRANGNGQEGIDLEEDDDVNGGGDLVAELVNVTVNGNGFADPTNGLKIEEDGVGNLTASITGSRASDNAAAGATFEQQQSDPADSGTVELSNFTGTGNPDGLWVTDGPVTVTGS
jgi:hypothetical protein